MLGDPSITLRDSSAGKIAAAPGKVLHLIGEELAVKGISSMDTRNKLSDVQGTKVNARDTENIFCVHAKRAVKCRSNGHGRGFRASLGI